MKTNQNLTSAARAVLLLFSTQIILAGVLALLVLPARADTFGGGGNTFTIDFVEIGNPGNGNDLGAGGGSYSAPYGGVAYTYRMGIAEVPQEWITKATNLGMTNVTAGAWSGRQPAANMTWYEAAALVNWLNTSRGYHPAYDLTYSGGWSMRLWSSGQAWQAGGENLYRHKDAFYFLPSDDEWHKAAFHKNDGVTANYWDYATGSNTIPIATASGTGAGTVVYNQAEASPPATVDNTGGLSPYGTRGQDGNAAEWQESAFDGLNNSPSESRAIRGGVWSFSEFFLRSSHSSDHDPSSSDGIFGFRVASAAPIASVVPGQSYLPAGGSLALSVNYILDVPSTYQWQFNGTNLPGATNSTLALSNVTTNDSGSYRVTVSNAYEVVTATAAAVQVVNQVTLLSQPASTNVSLGSNVTLRVVALSPLPITYQWQFNGVDLSGQNSSTLALTNVQMANDGLYTVVATDGLRSVTSEPAALTVWVKPVIVQAPLSQSVVAGGSVTFSTEITGQPAPFLYQWRQGPTTMTNMVLTEKKAFFTLDNVRTNQAGLYRVVITNAASPSLTVNATWNLTVLPDTDGDGLPDAWETAHGLNATDPADAALDSDGDGQSNLGEYRAGTSPTNAASCLKLEGVTHANGTATVIFNAVSNQTYTVEWCADLSGAWTRLTDLIARTNSRVESVTDSSASDAARFYRVLTPRRP